MHPMPHPTPRTPHASPSHQPFIADPGTTIPDEDDDESDDSDLPDLEPTDADVNVAAENFPGTVPDVASTAKTTAPEPSEDAASQSVVTSLLAHPKTRLQRLSVGRCGIGDFSPSSARHFIDRLGAPSVLRWLLSQSVQCACQCSL